MVIAYSDKVGQFAKLNAIKTYKPALFWAITCLILFELVAGILIGLMWGQSLVVFFALVAGLFALIGIMHVMMKILDKRMDEASRRRIYLLKGGQAEALVGVHLRESLSHDYHLFDNLKLDATSDLDHVLIGPSGLYVISTKSHRGHFQLSPGQTRPTFNNKPIEPKDWAQDAVQQALRLRTTLPHYVDDPNAKAPWVQAVLCLPFAHIDTPKGPTGVPSAGKCWVLHEDNLIDHLAPDTHGDPVAKYADGPKLRKAEIERWAAALKVLHDRHCTQPR